MGYFFVSMFSLGKCLLTSLKKKKNWRKFKIALKA